MTKKAKLRVRRNKRRRWIRWCTSKVQRGFNKFVRANFSGKPLPEKNQQVVDYLNSMGSCARGNSFGAFVVSVLLTKEGK